MSIFYGLVAQGTTIKAEYKTNSALDDAGKKKKKKKVNTNS
jgi:hypothetical protein